MCIPNINEISTFLKEQEEFNKKGLKKYISKFSKNDMVLFKGIEYKVDIIVEQLYQKETKIFPSDFN